MWQDASSIDAVIFDYAGVIAIPAWDLSAQSVHGNVVSHAEIVTVINAGYADPQHPLCQWERGDISFEGFRSAMAMWTHESEIDWSTLDMAILPAVQIEPMVEAARRVRSQNVPTAVLSNTMHEFAACFQKSGIETLFDVQVMSCKLGCRKPEPEIFDKALAKLGVDASKTLFLDDNPICIEGAAAVGLQTILVDDPVAVADELNTLLCTREQRFP